MPTGNQGTRITIMIKLHSIMIMRFYPIRIKYFFILMGRAIKPISSYLCADGSGVLNSSTYSMHPHSADWFHALLNWKEDLIKLCQFVFMEK